MIRAWICEAGGAREVTPAEAMAAVNAGSAHAWIDIEGGDAPGATDARTVSETLEPLHIHPLVLEDMVMEINRPKVDDYGRYLYVVVHAARWDGPRPSLHELDIVVGAAHCVPCLRPPPAAPCCGWRCRR